MNVMYVCMYLCMYFCGFRPLPNESKECFCQRRNHLASILKRGLGAEVRRRWAYKVATWIEHLRRHPESIGCRFLSIQDDAWLRSQRLQAGKFSMFRSLDGGATETRAGAGYPIRFAAMWLEALSENGGLSDPERYRSISKANADQLFQLVFARRSGLALRLRDQ